MSFCINCGKELTEGTSFCANCGKTINENDSTNKRKTVYEGEIHKCPVCGETLDSLIGNCPTCGYEIRGKGVSSSVKEFALKLNEADIDSQKVDIIRNFPIPNTKEDIFEFMILASTNIGNKIDDDITKAWIVKVEQCYQKASVIIGKETVEFSNIQSLYNDILEKKEYDKKQNTYKKYFNILKNNIGAIFGILVLFIAVFFDFEISKMLELFGCGILIVTASTLHKRNAMLLDYGITALSVGITFWFAEILSNGSMLQLGGLITLIILIVNFFKMLTNGR